MDCPDLTRDGFLGGQLTVHQPARGYRAGIDPVLLAASVPARAGESVLELGIGTGVASLCMAARVPGLALTGLELQPEYADLARRNGRENGVEIEVLTGDLTRMPAALKARRFDHVIANPPYYRAQDRARAADPGREAALAGDAPLGVWIDAAARRLAPRGTATFIQRADRAPELLAAMATRLGSLRVQILYPRPGRVANLVVVSARQGGRAAPEFLPPVFLHDGATHRTDRPDYTPQIDAVLRSGAGLPLSG